jgi:hypothetical protein
VKMLNGELSPAGGYINYLQGKSVVKLSPLVGKKDRVLSVSDFLAQFSASPEAINQVMMPHLLFVVFTSNSPFP